VRVDWARCGGEQNVLREIRKMLVYWGSAKADDRHDDCFMRIGAASADDVARVRKSSSTWRGWAQAGMQGE